MAVFMVTDPQTGVRLRLTGDSPPSEAELEQIFAQQSQPQAPSVDQTVQTDEDFLNLIGQQEPGLPGGELTFAQRQARKLNPLEAGVISAGRGLTNIGRAVGLVDQEDPSEAEIFGAVQKEFPVASEVGQVVGETAPFLLPGTALGAVAKLAPRVAAATGLGITEGAIVSRGRGADIEKQITGGGIGGAIAGTAEVLFPVIGRLGGKLIRSVTGKAPAGSIVDDLGRPTPELQDALEKTGISFGELTERAQNTLKTSGAVDPEQAARAARLESLDAPATQGDISLDFAQQAAEARLVESAADPLGGPLRNIRLEQSQAFKAQLDEQIQKLGVNDDLGESLKDAISSRKTVLTKEKNDLYRKAAQQSDQIKDLPIITDGIASALPEKKDLRRLSRISGNDIEAVEDLMVEFGISNNPVSIDKFLETGGEIIPLNVGNFEEFRQALNQLGDNSTSGGRATLIVTNKIKSALDKEGDLIGEALVSGGITDTNVLGAVKEARKTVRQIKTEFSPQSITGKLIDVKRDGVTPIIEGSKVFNELIGTNKPPELLQRTIDTLNKGGTKGKRGIGDLQAATILDLVNSAFNAQTRKIDGVRTFGGTAFNKRLEQIGDEKLNILFKNQPAALRKLKTIGKAAEDLTPPSGAVPKGSASVILDSLNRLGILGITGKVPGGALFAETLRTISEKSQNRKSLERALNAKPAQKKMASFIANDFPGLASPLGIAFLSTQQANE